MHKNGNKLDNRIENLEIGSQHMNIRQHWDAQIEAEQWKRVALVALSLMNRT
jgi:hypothetical protein